MLQSLDRLRHHELLTRSTSNGNGNGNGDADANRQKFTIADLLIDERDMVVRYFVADTGHWLPGRKVLISPEAIIGADWDNEILQTNLTEQEIEDAPPLMADAPISLEYRRDLAMHYGWSAYTSFHPILGGYGWMRAGDVPAVSPGVGDPKSPPGPQATDGVDTTLRSAHEIIGYDIEGTDEAVGHLEDIIVDTSTWTLRYFVIDTVNWMPFSRKVLVPVGMLREIRYPTRRVLIALTKEQITNSPEFDMELPVEPQQEVALFGSYARTAP